MKITVCIGSSCYLKGSKSVIKELQRLLEENNLQNQVELCGAFCMGRCTEGVCVTVGENLFSLRPDNTQDFFESEIQKNFL
ncbi:(2Fe-2S) ferredoxin domain-containing protein [Scatolibacter rhodanostii]|uniref:(2Fe-2S) ferredoxin domain-containing protein n=1 Tax=Scatolibacter rhodanostii TaxID=2014781 RepID=UPI000C075B24|nr:(2Fe-2S) ferredoxin domain-containing protein [Scatolibacter rhodanostii]